MISELIQLMKLQREDLKSLLMLLDIQYKMIMDRDIFGLESLVDRVNECGKLIAEKEVQRRKLLGGESIKTIIKQSSDEQLKEAYSNIRETLNKVVAKKETNEILLKQGLVFNNKMLTLFNPSREIKTYTSYGSLSK